MKSNVDSASGLSAEENYHQAVSRNIGIFSQQEQAQLKSTRVGIAGLGGMGGVDFLTLVRMGIGKFNIADMDTFDVVNANRQVGAFQSSYGQPKIEVMASLAKEINPSLEVTQFPQGVQEDNIDEFVKSSDIIVDAIDFFCFSARKLLYEKAREHNKYIVFSAPLGFSATLHVFSPSGMSFNKYFDIQPDMSKFEQLVAFVVGLTPMGTHWKYMEVNKERLRQGIGPSVVSACNIGSGMLSTEIVSILLKRRPARSAPYYIQFDPYRYIYRKGRLLFGNRGPLQRFKRWLLKRQFADLKSDIEHIVK